MVELLYICISVSSGFCVLLFNLFIQPNAHALFMLDPNFIISLPADGLTPNGTRPSAGKVLATKRRWWRTEGTQPWLEVCHHDIIKWKHFPHYLLFVRGIHQSPVDSPHKGQWHRALIFSLINSLTNGEQTIETRVVLGTIVLIMTSL